MSKPHVGRLPHRRKIRHLFEQALDVAPADRAAYVERVAGKGELRDVVLSMLRRHAGLGEFLVPPTVVEQAAAGSGGGEDGDPPAAPPPEPGTLLGGRYVLGDPLGSGGGGTVHAGLDTLTGRAVALKLLQAASDAELRRTRREAATLRWLRLPGVVQILDDGVQDGRAYLVTERVEGRPFPGRPIPCAWTDLARPALALTETLARLHHAGVVHRDLKPENVLVRPNGVPVVLDLGIAAGTAVTGGMEVAGSLGYIAPEQLRGAAATPAADLYSLGALLHHCLTGSPPPARGPLPPVGEACTGLPASLVALLESLLSEGPGDRPGSAEEVASALRDCGDAAAAHGFPRLGGHAAVDALVAAGRERRALDVTGAPGSGRSRALAEAAARLRANGYRVVELVPGNRPFESLGELAGAPPADARLEAALEGVVRTVGDALAAGLVVTADAPAGSHVDRATAQVLDRIRERGAVLRAVEGDAPGGGDLHLAPVTEQALRALFDGPERVLHLPGDAARELHRRTGGNPGRVERELRAWVRAGLAHRDGDRFVVRRRDLGRIRDIPHLAPPAPGRSTALPPPELADLLAWVDLAGEDAQPEALARAAGRPLWEVEGGIARLRSLGLVTDGPDGHMAARPGSVGGWEPARRADAHRRFARVLEAAHPRRLGHLLAGGDTDGAAHEALAAAERRLLDGAIPAAAAAILEGLRAAQTARLRAVEERLLRLAVATALAAGTRPALDAALHEVQRALGDGARVEPLEALARAALRCVDGDGTGAHSLLEAGPDGGPEFHDTEEGRMARAIRALASRSLGPERESREVAEAVAWAEGTGDPAALAAAAEWQGWLAYRRHAFPEAVRLHRQCAERAVGKSAQVSSLLNAASAALAAFDLDAAAELAGEARTRAVDLRHANHEARAECLLREIAYRSDRAGEPDTELADILDRLGVRFLAALLRLNEAAVAWRMGRLALARDLAEEAAAVFEGRGSGPIGRLARALAAACGGPLSRDACRAWAQEAAASPVPGVDVQTLGLAARCHPDITHELEPAARTLAARLETSHHAARREVLSVNEALEVFNETRSGARPGSTDHDEER